MSYRSSLKQLINKILSRYGFTLARKKDGKPWDQGLLTHYLYQKALKEGRDPGQYTLDWPPLDFSPDMLSWQHVAKMYTPGQVVLELGPGPGRYTDLIIETCSKVYLIDYSETVKWILLDKYGADSRVQIILTENCKASGVSTCSVDLAYSLGTFVHLHQDQFYGYLCEFARVLKPGAAAVIEYGSIASEEGLRHFCQFHPQDGSQSIFHYYGFDMVKRMAEQAGLRVVDHAIDEGSFVCYLTLKAGDLG
jgi:SAM-dependent methyltransferase